MSTKLRPSAKEFVPGSKSKLRAAAAEFVPSPTSAPKAFVNGVGGSSKSSKKNKEAKEDFTHKHPSALKIEDPSEAKDSPSPVDRELTFPVSTKGSKNGQRPKPKAQTGLDEEEKEDEEDEDLPPSKPSRKQSLEDETKAEQGLENSIKKHTTYTREFILNLREHAASPREKEIMDQIAKVLGKAATASPRTAPRGRIDPRARGRGQRGGKGVPSRRGGGGRSRRPESPMNIEIKELEKTDNRYVILKDIPPDKQLIRSVTGILNKLTPEKFDRLLKQVLELKIDSSDRLRDTVTAVFEKALAEPDFSPIYAEFALHLSKKLAGYEVGKEAITFKRLLLNHCQQEFEKEAPPSPATLETPADEQEGDGVISKTKRRMLATIRFIGELYARKMISSSIIQYCITMLLGKVEAPEELKLDALCKLLATIGKVYDSEKNKAFLDQTFSALKELATKKQLLSSRLRFKIQDTLDLREDNWVDRKQTLSQKKLSEIRKEASQKEEPEPRRNSRYQTASPRKTPKTPTRSPPTKNPEDEWETVVGGGKGKRGRQDVRYDSRRPPAFSPKQSPSQSSRDTPKQKGNGREVSTSQRQTPKSTPPTKQTALAPGERPKVTASSFNAFDLLDDDDEPKEFKSKKKASTTAKKPTKKVDDLDLDIVVTDKFRSTQEKLFSSALDKTDTESRSSKQSGDDDYSESADGDREKLEAKVKGLIEEYFSTQDLQEAARSNEELPPKAGSVLVSQGLLLAGEKKDEERDLLAQLFAHLYSQKTLPRQSLEEGFREVLDLAEEMLLDIPYLLDHLGVTMGKLIEKEAMNLNFITQDLLSSLKTENRKKFVGHVLTTIKTEGGEENLQTIFKASKINLEKLLEQDSDSFLEDQDLSCLVAA